jgi:hypothetical protein
MKITETMVEAAILAMHRGTFDLANDGVPFVSPPRHWWMIGEPHEIFNSPDEAKAYAVRAQMRAALEAALR